MKYSTPTPRVVNAIEKTERTAEELGRMCLVKRNEERRGCSKGGLEVYVVVKPYREYRRSISLPAL